MNKWLENSLIHFALDHVFGTLSSQFASILAHSGARWKHGRPYSSESMRFCFVEPETNKSQNDSLYGPNRFPIVRVVMAYGKADTVRFSRLEPTIFGEHVDTRWFHWIILRAQDLAQVDS